MIKVFTLCSNTATFLNRREIAKYEDLWVNM
nr:MAG TPA: hypothetical protein [Caudoviricetes sp.]